MTAYRVLALLFALPCKATETMLANNGRPLARVAFALIDEHMGGARHCAAFNQAGQARQGRSRQRCPNCSSRFRRLDADDAAGVIGGGRAVKKGKAEGVFVGLPQVSGRI